MMCNLGTERFNENGGVDLGWFALQVVMLLCWLRADSVAGFQPGDCVVNADCSLTVCVWHMKMRPEFKTNPGVIELAEF
jgi:hypothetical protein